MHLITSAVASCLILFSSATLDVVQLRNGKAIRGQIVREERGWIGVATDGGVVWATTESVRSVQRDDADVEDRTETSPSRPARAEEAAGAHAPPVTRTSAQREYDHIRRLLSNEEREKRARATAWIVETWPRWRGVAVVTLLDGPEPARLDIVRLLRQKRLRKSRDLLMTALGDPSAKVRLAALRAVRHREDRTVESKVIEMLRSDPMSEVCHEAIRTLEEIGGRESLPALLSVMRNHTSAGIRQRCRRALRRIIGVDHGDDARAWGDACDDVLFAGKKVRGDE